MAVPLQHANPRVGRVARQRQTTVEPSGGRFNRASTKGRRLAFDSTGLAYGAQVGPSTLKPVGGYIRHIPILLKDVEAGNSANVAFNADSVEATIQNLILRDPFGEPIIEGPGYEVLRLVPMFSGQGDGFYLNRDPHNLPSFATTTGTGATGGSFTLRSYLPLELMSNGYCSLPSMNAAAQMSLQVVFNAAASVYSTSPNGTRAIEFRADLSYWSIPIGDPQLAPPDLGSSHQWHFFNAAQGINSGGAVEVVIPRVGTWITTIIGVLRDSTNARIAAFPTDPVRLTLDGVDLYSEPVAIRQDEVFGQFGLALPTGVIVWSFRDSVEQAPSSSDTGDNYIHTTPGTDLEVRGTWGTVSNAPAILTGMVGELYPLGGIPYGHLAG